MVADYKIYLTIGDVRVEMSNFISKLSLSFQHNLCSTSWKSVTDTASCILQFNDRNIPQLAEVVSKLIEAQQAFPPEEVKFEAVSKDDETTYFYGYLDLGKLSVESSKLPGSVSLTAKSFMDKLDVKPHVNFVLYPSTVREVVEKCLVEAGFTDNVKWISSVGGMKVQVPFVVTEDDSDTWRDKIDTLLSEMGGYTLSYDHKDKLFFVSKVNDESKKVSDTPIRYHVQTKLKSTSTKYAKDGVVVSYGNLKTSKDQLVYIHNISLSQGDVLDPEGDEVKPGDYYPFDSDVTKTLEEYQTDLLDYRTLIGNTRKANEHISIYYVDPASTKVTIVASDMEGKGVSDWNDNQTFYSPEGGFTYPAGGAFYPRKAWFCFRNKSDKSVNLTRFSISGDTYYSDAEYKMVMPPDCKEPDEYSAKYIIDTETVKNFATFLMNQKRFGGDTTTWTERWEDHEIGDKVEIQHKSGNIINAVIVRKESIIYGKELWAKITAVSTDGWSFEQPSLVQGSVHSPSLLDPYENAKRNGYTGSREQWESRNDIFYLWSSSETELKPKKRAFWKLGGKWMLFANLPVGDFGMQDWMNSWSEVMAERTEEYNYLWAKVGEDGEPFLLQGQPAKIFALSLSSYTFIRDKRRVGENQEIKIELQIWGYYGTPKIVVSNGSFNEETGILTIPYDNTYDTITVIASISDAPTQMAYISVVDETEYSKYWGASDMEPAGVPVEGDSWFNLLDNLIYRYTNGSWMLLSESGVSLGEISEICAKAQKDALSIIEAGSLTASDYAYFNTIIAGTITADYISSKDIKSQNFIKRTKGYRLQSENGKLEAIDAEISGDISSDVMCSSYAETLASSGLSLTSAVKTVNYFGSPRSVNAFSIEDFSALTVCGTYIFDGGTVNNSSSSYTANSNTPFYVIKEPYTSQYLKAEEAFSIKIFASRADVAGIYLGILYLYPDDDGLYLHDQGDHNSITLSLSSPRKAILTHNILPLSPPSNAFAIGDTNYPYSSVDIGSLGCAFRALYARFIYGYGAEFGGDVNVKNKLTALSASIPSLYSSSAYIGGLTSIWGTDGFISLNNDLIPKDGIKVYGAVFN